MGQRYSQLILLVLIGGLFTGCAWSAAPVAAVESAHTPKGVFLMWHRAPATEKDLGMPLYRQGTTLESYTYRVRDRKRRNFLFYACVRLTTKQTVAELLDYAQRALGADAQRETDAQTGVVTLVAGSKQDCRIVEVTPGKEGCQLKLEHVQHFEIPPRVYTAQEKKVLQQLSALTAAYHSASHVAYRVEQRVEVIPSAPPKKPHTPASAATARKLPTTLPKTPSHAPATAPVAEASSLPQIWNVDFTRPDHLNVTAMVNGVVGLHLSAQDGNLQVINPGKNTLQRTIGNTLTMDKVPELQDDAVARLMLGDSLISDKVDYLALLPVPGMPINEQVEIVLTYPIDQITVRLRIDRRRQVIIRGEILHTDEERTLRVERTYSNMLLDTAASAPGVHTPIPRQPATEPDAESAQ